MAAYTPPTARDIFRRLAARVVARTELTDLHEGGELAQLLGAFAQALHEIAQGVLTLRNQRILGRLTGEDLDAFALEVLPDGQQRRAGTRATAYGTFSRSGTTGAQTIPAGHVVARSDGVSYQSVASTTISDGSSTSAAVQVIAQQVGTSANGAVGSILRVVSTSPAGLSFANTTAATGGTDRETDDEFRARIVAYLRSLSGCNRTALETRAREAELDTGERVKFAKSFPGSEAGQSILYVDDGTGLLSGKVAVVASETLIGSALGTETVFYTQFAPIVAVPVLYKDGVALTNGTDYRCDRATGAFILASAATAASAYTLDDGYSYWTGLVAEAHRLIYGDPADLVTYPPKVADGASILVQGAVSQTVTISATLRVRKGYTSSTVQDDVTTAIVALVNSLDIGETLYTGQIVRAAMNVDGALDFDLTSPTADQTPGQNKVIRITSDDVTLALS